MCARASQSAWVLPLDAQTESTGTLAEYLTSLGVEVDEVNIDDSDDDEDDDESPNANGLVEAEAQEVDEEVAGGE